jgi:catechol 2,3-dioxygenase-like lactoylglutathione lyase family enzyme
LVCKRYFEDVESTAYERKISMSTKNVVVKDITLEIPVKDIQQSADWYSKHLGFEVILPLKGIAELKLPSGMRICLFRPSYDDINSYWYVQEKENYRVHANLRVSDIHQLHRELIEFDVRVGEIEGGEGCGWTFEFWDVNDNKLVAWSGYTQIHDWYYE